MRQKKVNDIQRGPALFKEKLERKIAEATATLAATLLMLLSIRRCLSLRRNCSLPSNKLVFPLVRESHTVELSREPTSILFCSQPPF